MKPKGLPCSRAIAHPCRDVTRDVELLEEKLEEGEVLGLPGSQQLVSIERSRPSKTRRLDAGSVRRPQIVSILRSRR